MAFHDAAVFPTTLSYGTVGGPSHENVIQETPSGRTYVVARRPYPLMRYDVASRVKLKEDAAQLLTFARARRGSMYGFRFLDFTDFSTATDHVSAPNGSDPSHRCVIGTGDGNRTNFELAKVYDDGVSQSVRRIEKPMRVSEANAVQNGSWLQTATAATLHRVWVNGSLLSTSQYSIDYLNGEVNLANPPYIGQVVEWAGAFFVPCRFGREVDQWLAQSIDDYATRSFESLSIVESPQDSVPIALERGPRGSGYVSLVSGQTVHWVSWADGEMQVIPTDDAGGAIDLRLPREQSWMLGGPLFRFWNSGSHMATIRTFTGTQVYPLPAGWTCELYLIRNQAQTGYQWLAA